MAGVHERKRKMVEGLVAMHLQKCEESGAELVMGQGRFFPPRRLRSLSMAAGGARWKVRLRSSTRVRGRRLITFRGYWTPAADAHRGAGFGELPEHLVVLGGGYVGTELAQAFRRFGSRVTLDRAECHARPSRGSGRHRGDRRAVSRREDRRLGPERAVERIEGESGKSVGSLGEARWKRVIFLVAGGRTPNTDGIGNRKTGVEIDERGHVKVNDRLETTAKGIWAGGDCAGSPYFTHIAEDDFRIVLANLAGGNRTTTGRQVPFCLFTDPELARIGLNERRRGTRHSLPPGEDSHDGRAHAPPITTHGFLKAIVEEKSDRILGFTAPGTEAGELLPVVQLAMHGSCLSGNHRPGGDSPHEAEGWSACLAPCRRHGNRGPTA